MTDARDEPHLTVPASELGEGATVATGGKTTCYQTGAVLREGDEAIVEITQVSGFGAWTLGDVFHPAAAPTDDPVTEHDGTVVETLFLRGRLGVCSDAAMQKATLRLLDAEVVAYYQPDTE